MEPTVNAIDASDFLCNSSLYSGAIGLGVFLLLIFGKILNVFFT